MGNQGWCHTIGLLVNNEFGIKRKHVYLDNIQNSNRLNEKHL